MIVGCPRCKKKLRVPDEKIKPGGSKFKCPGCSAVLLVRRPGEAAAKPPEREKAVAPVAPVKPVPEVPKKPEEPKEPKEEIPEPFVKPVIKPAVKPVLPEPEPDAKVERAKRLARTVLSDINLYQGAEVEEAIRNDNFQEAFADALKEGLKLYGNKIAPDVRAMGDFYNEAVLNFIEKKKEALGL